MKLKFITAIGVLCLLIISCSKEEPGFTPAPPPPPASDFVVPTITPTGNERYLNENSDVIFDQQQLHTFEIDIPDASMAQIDANPVAEQYVECMLTFDGESISPVGIRYKGSIGAFVNCLSGTDWANPSGHKTCTKLSMKVKINWNDTDDKFYGLKKLQFHSMNHDDSHMRERLGYWFYRQMGVPAPRSVHARLVINGEFVGVFALTEQIDGRFTRYNFDDGDGNLYKEIWPLRMDGQPYAEQDFINKLKTNEEDNPSAALIRGFAQNIADASEEDLQAVIASKMNITEIISHIVVDRTIRHDDGPFHWYCDGNWCTNHNYYWYEEPSGQTLHLIPWDLDNAFENIIVNTNPVTPIADEWGETSANCQPFPFGWFGVTQWSAACDKLTAGWANFSTEYDQIKQSFIDGPLSEAQTSAMLDAWSNQIRDAVIEARTTHSDAISQSVWQAAVDELKTQLAYAREN
ncbi:MAG: CotH kinase family protein [Bacteroidota bacterium]